MKDCVEGMTTNAHSCAYESHSHKESANCLKFAVSIGILRIVRQ